MNYSNPNITQRAAESTLWQSLSNQNSNVLPYLLERYLLLENWRFLDHLEKEEIPNDIDYNFSFVHLLIAELTTVVLNQEQRIRALEAENTDFPDLLDDEQPF